MRLKKRQIIQLVIDLVLLLIVGIPFLVVHIVVKPFQRGFFCDDQSIRYPYKPDTISMGVCAVTWILPGVAIIILVEFIWSKKYNAPWFEACWNTAKVIVCYGVGAGVTVLLTEIAKLSIGRLRPHFISVCRPDFAQINCSAGYVQDFTCLNTDGHSEKILTDSRKSFPSGHASFSTFCAFFIAFYCQQRLARITWSVMLKVVLQTAAAAYAIFVMTSRVSDYKHHWSDVLVGGIFGILCGIWMVLILGRHISYFGRWWWTRPEIESATNGRCAAEMEDGGSYSNQAATTVPFRFQEKPQADYQATRNSRSSTASSVQAH